MTKYLDQGEYLLDENKVIIKSKIEDKNDIIYDLETLYRQVPNTNWARVFPRERSYFRMPNQKRNGKIRQWWRRTMGEKPSIYSDSLTTSTALDMQKYLKYNGFLDASVIPQRDPRRKRMRVSYYILPGVRYVLDTVNFYSPDTVINNILNKNALESHFKNNGFLDLSLFSTEKQRITTLLRNKGYAEFYTSYIDDLEIDSFQVRNHVNLYVNVLAPYGDSVHQQYRIGEVNIYFAESSKIVRDTSIAGVNFYLSEQGFIVSSATLRKAISLRPGVGYSQEAHDQTLGQLSELGMFRFVRIKQFTDTLEKDLIHFNIQLTPNYKMEFNANLDVSYTNAPSNPNASNLIGFSISPSLLNRNLLGGAELLLSSFYAGLEVAPSNFGKGKFWNTVDVGASFSLSLPDFVDYLGVWRRLYRLKIGKDKHLLNKAFYTGLGHKANTRIQASYNYLEIFNWRSHNLASISYGFDYKPDRNRSYSINHFAINYLDPVAEPAFGTVLMNNGFLARSFGQQLFVSLLFRDLVYVKKSRTTKRGRFLYFSANVETAGAEILGINKLYNRLSGNKNAFLLGGDISISQFVRLESDIRYLKQITLKKSLAARFKIGVAKPFGFTSDVPYEKQFVVGGANSIRAWVPRELGPGGYLDPDPPENNSEFFQSGDFIMEFSAEYRFPLISIVNMAFFVDVGNVWTLDEDKERPGSQFRITEQPAETSGFIQYPFYRQFAVSPGAGLRVDLSFFIFRFDVGMKMRNPFPDTIGDSLPESAWWNKPSEIGPDDFGYNFGLGFPF